MFVFGSNLAGIHGAGAAAFALTRGWTLPGLGLGLYEGTKGRSFALPTKDWDVHTLELTQIQLMVDMLLWTARMRKELEFLVTPIGCGFAGYTLKDIAPLFFTTTHKNHDHFADIYPNVHLPSGFWAVHDSL